MTTVYSKEMSVVNAGKHVYGGIAGGRIRRYRATVDLAAQPSGDTIVLSNIMPGETFSFGVLYSSVSLGAATLAIGTEGAADAYMTAATVTTADKPVFFGKVAAAGANTESQTDRTTVIATVGAAALPAAGTLVIDVYTSGV